MLRQVSLEVRWDNRLQDAAKEFGTQLMVVDCRPFNRTGMTLLLELKGEQGGVRKTIAALRKIEGVRQAIEGDEAGTPVPLLLVLDRPSVCKASSESGIICLECPLDSDSQPASWKFIVKGTGDLRQVLNRLAREGLQTRIEDVSRLDHRATLTARQREVIATAVAKGYFEFPRRISLTNLSKLVGVKPSTLSEILRGAERRIMESAVGVLPPEGALGHFGLEPRMGRREVAQLARSALGDRLAA